MRKCLAVDGSFKRIISDRKGNIPGYLGRTLTISYTIP